MKAAYKALGVITGTAGALRAFRTSKQTITEQKQSWAKAMLKSVNLHVQVIGSPTSTRPCVFVGSHLSYFDIPLILSCVPDVNFVAKAELQTWPIFGSGMRKTNTIFVRRDSADSRNQAMDTLRKAVLEEAKPVLVFPSGTTCLHEQKQWKAGAFRLAQETGVPLQPFRIRYSPLREAAFIDDDGFLSHLYNACKLEKIEATLEFAPAEMVSDALNACSKWQAWAAEGL